MKHRNPFFPLFLFLILSLFLFDSCQPKPSAAPLDSRPESFAEDSLRAIWLNNKAELFSYQGELDSSIYHFRQLGKTIEPLLTFTEDSLLWALYIDSYFNRGYLSLLKNGVTENSELLLDTCLTLVLERFGEAHLITTKIYNKLANHYLVDGELDKAYEFLNRSFEIRKKILPENDIFLSHGYYNMSNFYRRLGDIEKALAYSLKALSIRRNIYEKGDHTLKSIQEVKEANLNDRQSPVLKDMVLRFGWQVTADSYLMTGEMYRQLGNEKEADWHFEKGFQLLENHFDLENPYLLLPHLHYGLSKIRNGYRREGKRIVDRAFDHYGPLYPFQEDVKFMKYTTSVYTFSLEKKYREALHFQSMIMEGLSSPTPLQAVENHYETAYLLTKLNRWEEALRHTQQGLQALIPDLVDDPGANPPVQEFIFATSNILSLLTLKGHILRQLYAETGDKAHLENAMNTLERAMEYLNYLRLNFFSDASKLTLVRQNYQLTELITNTTLDLFFLHKDDYYRQRAFELIEQNKAAVLRQALQRTEALKTSDIPSRLAEQYKKTKEVINWYRQRLFNEKNKGLKADSVMLRVWESGLVTESQRRDSLESVILEAHPRYLQLLRIDKKVTIAGVQEMLAAERSPTTLLEYFLGDSTLIIYCLQPDTFFLRRRQVEESFFGDLDLLRKAASANPSKKAGKANLQQLTGASHRLYRQLIPPELEIPENGKLLIIPDGQLNTLPFEVLLEAPVQEGQPFTEWPFLMHRYPLRYEYSAAFLQSSVPAPRATGDYVGFAPIYADASTDAWMDQDTHLLRRRFAHVVRDGLSPLRFNRPEVETAATQLGGNAVTGALATEKAFKEQAPRHRILHLAMHALVNDTDPQYSQLLFSDGGAPDEDGRLHVYELYNMKLNAEMAVLSACNTGAGQLQRGEGAMSLARAFKYAGCPNIVMSLWPANDAATKDLMVDFFHHLQEGLPKDEALRQAKLDFLDDESHIEQQHPFYWAAFVLIGDGEAMEFGKPWGWSVLAGIGMLFLVGAAFYYRMHRR